MVSSKVFSVHGPTEEVTGKFCTTFGILGAVAPCCHAIMRGSVVSCNE